MERNLITGIAADKNEARVTLTGVPDKPGTVAHDLRAARRGGHPRRHDRPRGDPNTGESDADLHRAARRASPRPMAVLETAQGARSAMTR